MARKKASQVIEQNLIINTHLLSIVNQLTNHLVDKVEQIPNWHEKEAQIAFKMVLAELEYHAKVLKEDLPEEYRRKVLV